MTACPRCAKNERYIVRSLSAVRDSKLFTSYGMARVADV